MINHYYGGNISQDYLGYNARARSTFAWQAPGAEFDLNYALNRASGPAYPLVSETLGFALGGVEVTLTFLPPGGGNAAQRGQTWNTLTAEIDAGRPILLVYGVSGGRTHAVVMFGYAVDGSGPGQKRYVLIMDPGQPFSASARRGPLDFDRVTFVAHYRITDTVITNNVTGNPADLAFDTDRDGINDFDEKNRFGTDPQRADTDGDCINDKEEIRLSMDNA